MPSSLQTIATVQVFDYLYDPTTGLPVANQTVTVSWKQKLGSVTAPVVQAPPRTYQAITDANGYWTIPALVPTNLLNPANSVYTVSDGYNVYDINPITAGMPVGGWQALAIRVSPAPAVLPVATTLTGPLTVTGLLQVNGPMGVTGLFTAANINMAALSATTGVFSGLVTFNAGLTAVAPITLPAASLPESTITNLVADLAAKALDNLVAHLAGVETITGAKTFSIEPVAPDFKATGATSLGSPINSRFIGSWSTFGAPTGLTAAANDYGFDGNGFVWICITAGTPGTWKTLPGGILANGYAQVVADQTTISALVDLTSLTVTVTVGSGRRIRVSCNTEFLGTTVDGQVIVSMNGDGSQIQAVSEAMRVLTLPFTVAGSVILTPTAGSHTYKLQAASQNTGTMSLKAATTSPAWIMAEDIGV